MTSKILRCAIYVRVSTSEQMMHGKSIQAQREHLERYVKEHNMTLAGIYADEGKTARKELKKRKAIHALLEDVKSDKIDVIVFWRLDRWFRNMSDFYKVQDILDKYNVHWISASEPGISMDTRDGRLQLNVVLSIGQNEVDTTSERIRFVNEASIRQGKLIFGEKNMPFGFKAGVKDGVKQMIQDESKIHMVEEFYKFYKVHQSKLATVKHMRATFGIDFSYSMLRTMLSSEFYVGTYRGHPYCPAYLSEQEWSEIQRISKSNIKSQRSDRVYLFAGLIHCPVCKNKLSGTGCSSVINRKTQEKRTYCYYRCNSSFFSGSCENRHRLSQNLTEEYLINNLELEYKKYKIRGKKTEEQKEKKKNVRTATKIQSEMDRLSVLFQKERINWEYYDKEYDLLDKEIRELRVVRDEFKRDLSYMDELIQSDFKSMYESLTSENKQAFWRSTISEIVLNTDFTVKGVNFH